MYCEWCEGMNYSGLFGYKVKGLGFRVWSAKYVEKTGDVTVVCTDD